MGFINPGDIYIDALVIRGKNRSTDVTNLMQMMFVYEDILLPGINIELVLLDDKELQEVLPLVGEETLVVSYRTPSKEAFTHTFALVAMEDGNATSNLKNKAYKLTGVATEVLTHKTTQVNKSYKTQCSKMIKDIFEKYLKSQKTLNVEETKGVQEYIITNKRPFLAMKDILVRSVSEKNASSSYVLFENQAGYNFVTMEKLFKEGSVAAFTNDEVVNDSVFRVIYRNIIGYNISNMYNTALKLGAGAFASTIQTYDMKTLLYGTKEVKPDVQSMTRGMQALMSSQQFKSQHQTSGVTNFVPKDSIKPPTYIDEMIPNRSAYAAELDQGRIHIRVFGDSSLTVGQCVDVRIMEAVGTTAPRRPHPLIAGKYIITKIRSVILTADVKPRYTQVLELVSGGYAKQV